MKKIISVLLILCMVFAVGCGDKKDDATQTGNSATEPAPTSAPSDSGNSSEPTTAQTGTNQTTAPTSKPTTPAGKYTPLNYDKMKAIWISQFDITNVYKSGMEFGFRTGVRKVFKDCANKGFNTVIIQVRPYGDSFYPSEYFPWSSYVTGSYSLNTKAFDPLAVMIEEAHAINLSLHAWINPMRLMTADEMKLVDTKYITRQWFDDAEKMGDYVIEYDGRLYLNPAHEEIRTLIIDGVKEICSNYNIDGMHMDDYFYPTAEPTFDQKSYDAFVEENGPGTTRQSFRKQMVNELVRNMYAAVKAIDSRVLFGISPAGEIQNNLNSLSADVKEWCTSDEYIDYICPQIYWDFENKIAAFDDVLGKWIDLTTNDNIRIIVGLALYKSGTDEDSWKTSTDIIKRELEYVINEARCSGVAVFSYHYMDGTAAKETANFVPVLTAW